MSEKIQPPRGTRDIYGAEAVRYRHVEDTARAVAARFGAGEMATPIFENAQLFKRAVGETSDIVSKEMYEFADKGGDMMCLRPENTAGVVRAVISEGLSNQLPLKVFYAGPMFRYERPQKGRYRQFSQIGLEYLGYDKPEADVEAIACGQMVLDTLGLAGRVVLELNSLGDAPSRAAHRAALIDYFTQHRAALSPESLARLDKNPLRILDSKNESDRELVAGAPRLADYYTPESRVWFDNVQNGLAALGIAARVNPSLVRGLDYYNHTVFEYVTSDLGAQGTVLAGGRYDGLSEMLGGARMPSIGWGAGIDRLMMMLDSVALPAPFVFVGAFDAATAPHVAPIAHNLRAAGFSVETVFTAPGRKQLEKANKSGAAWAIMLAENEWANGKIVVKNLGTGEQIEKSPTELIEFLRNKQ